MAEPEDPDETAAATSARGGRSTGMWAAVATLGAAAITGAVSLTTHFLPPSEAPDDQSATALSTRDASSETTTPADSPSTATHAPSSGSAPRSALLEKLTGTWSGQVMSGSEPFTLTLVITSSCVEGGPCGTMTSDLLPCVGNITLVKIDDGPAFDFATGSFTSDSSSSCDLRTGGGDYFVLGDDVLSYKTGYDGSLHGTLRRVP